MNWLFDVQTRSLFHDLFFKKKQYIRTGVVTPLTATSVYKLENTHYSKGLYIYLIDDRSGRVVYPK